MSVSVCLSARSHNSKSTRSNFAKLLYLLPVAIDKEKQQKYTHFNVQTYYSRVLYAETHSSYGLTVDLYTNHALFTSPYSADNCDAKNTRPCRRT